jgi:2,3,4,5-tetrahydropyridine-2,6-dicarboxylate N-succinyltransferase
MQKLREVIETAFDNRAQLSPHTADNKLKGAVHAALKMLDRGEARVAEKIDGNWYVNQWLKKAVMLSFRITENQIFEEGYSKFYDKVPLKYQDATHQSFHEEGVRIVPPACVRYGAFIAPQCIIMPSFVNLGAYVDTGTMIDTWATVGCCAQIGKNVHISGGAGIGGVLEPAQANPTIIEDNVFIGARSEIVEGVIVEENAVISMGVFIGQSTKIYDREHDTVTYGRVPAGSVVVAGSMPSKTGNCSLNCAVIVKRVDEKTRSKVSLNELLREA